MSASPSHKDTVANGSVQMSTVMADAPRENRIANKRKNVESWSCWNTGTAALTVNKKR